MILHEGQFPPMEPEPPGGILVTAIFTRISPDSDSFAELEITIERLEVYEDSGRGSIL